MIKRFHWYSLVLALPVLSLAPGCGWQKAVEDAPPVGFVTFRDADEPGVLTERGPFNYLWQNPDYEADIQTAREQGYSVYVAPVGTGYLQTEGTDDALTEILEEVATYLREGIIAETRALDDNHIQPVVTDDRDSAQYALELELTEIGLGSPALYAASWAVPLPGTTTAYDASHTSVLAFEGRFVDRESGEIVSELADRRIPKVRPIVDLNKMFSKVSPLRDISDDWANEIAHAMTTRLDRADIEGEGYVTFMPW